MVSQDSYSTPNDYDKFSLRITLGASISEYIPTTFQVFLNCGTKFILILKVAHPSIDAEL